MHYTADEACSLSGTGNPWVPVTRSGTGMGVYLYPSAGMGFLTGMFSLRGHGYGLVIPSGYVPVAIFIRLASQWCLDPMIVELDSTRILTAMKSNSLEGSELR